MNEPPAATKQSPILTPARWKALVAAHQRPRRAAASWQIINSVGGYLALWVAMFFTAQISWWLTIPLAVLAGALLVRVFIIFHDCGHGSFFKSQTANHTWGFITGVLTFTPYFHWRWEHAVHHATTGNLDHRGTGDIWTLTVDEYLASSPWRRFCYRVARNPVVLFLLAPLFLFTIYQRFPKPQAKPREKASVWIMNAALLALCTGLALLFGLVPWLVIQSVVLAVAGAGGVWLFYVQHQFEDAHWERDDDWDFTTAAIQGSSFYQLPRVLQWFSGNIGYHHIHHLSPRIPNYNLERCHRSDPVFANVKPLTLRASFKTIHYRLWDEQSARLISFGDLRHRAPAAAASSPAPPDTASRARA